MTSCIYVVKDTSKDFFIVYLILIIKKSLIGRNLAFNDLFIFSSNLLNLINSCKKNQIARLNKSYARIKVPHSFARSIRDFKSLVHWKANELKVFFYTQDCQFYLNQLKKVFLSTFVFMF